MGLLANRRQKKKAEKKQLIQKANTYKKDKSYNKKPIKEIRQIVKKQEKNKKERERYNKKKQLISKYGLDLKPRDSFEKINKAIDLKKKEQSKTKRRKSDRERRERYRMMLEQAGISDYTYKDLRSLKAVNACIKRNSINKIYSFPEKLYIGYYDKVDYFNVPDMFDIYSDYTIEELIRAIEELLYFTAPRGSSSGHAGDTIILSVKEKFDFGFRAVIDNNERKKYQTVCYTNKFTLRGYLALCAMMLNICREDERDYIFNKLKSYCRSERQIRKIFDNI